MSRNYGGTMVANMFVKFGADTTEYQKKMRAAVTRMLFAAESLTQAGRILSTAVTAPMLAIGAASLKTAMQFEASMMKMESLVGMPAETMARWKPVLLDMAGVVGKSANELAEALFFITSNGIRTDAALKVLEATAKASAIGLGETKDVAIAATSAMNAYGEGALTANESVAVLIGTIREGNLEAAELPSSLSKLLPVASAMGIAFHEAGAGIAAMSRSGTQARLAAFGLRAIMIGIQAPTHAAAQALRDVELSTAQVKKTIKEEGMLAALLQMKDAMEGTNVTLKDLFPNQRAYVAALQLLGENVDDTVEIFGNMAKVVGGDVDKSFQKGAKTMQRTYSQAMGDLSAAAVNLGDNMSPLIDKFGEVARSASETAKAYNELGDYHKGLITSAATFAITLGPVLYILGSLSRVTARFIGMSILLNLSWVKGTAKIIARNKEVGILTTSMNKLGVTNAQLAGNLLLAGVAGYQFGKWLDHALDITPKLNKVFGEMFSALDSVTDGLASSEAGLDGAAYAARGLALRMHESNLAMDLDSAAAAGNAAEMTKIINVINDKAIAYNKARIMVNGLTGAEEDQADAQQAIIDAQNEIDVEENDRLKKLREAHGLLTSQDVIDKMTELGNQYKDHIKSGVKQEMINERLSGDAVKLVDLAREYGIEATQGIKDMADSMNKTGDIENNEFYRMFAYYIPQAIDMMPGKVIPGMVKMGDEIAEKLTGGLSKGFTDSHVAMDTFNTRLAGGISKAYREGVVDFGEKIFVSINESVERMGPIEIDLVPNLDAFMDIYRDIQNGNIPDTGG